MNQEEILKNLEERLAKSKSEYVEVQQQMTEISDKFEQLRNKQQQIIGEYTGYYNMFLSIKNNNTEAPVSSDCEEIKPVQESVETKTSEKSSAKKTTKSKASVTAEEAEKLQSKLAKYAEDTQNKDVNGNEIPSYLTDEYKQ